jgi:hypothetical protein
MRKNTDHPLGPYPTGYARLLARLAQTGWFCQGTVVRRPLRRKIGARWVQKGPYYLWTGKRQGKTVCYALSQEQYKVARRAIETNRTVLAILTKLQTMTLEKILTKVPGVRKRK